MRKRRIILLSIGIIVTLLSFVTSTYAWLLYVQNQSNTGVVHIIDHSKEVTAKLYLGKDFDKNGELDVWVDETDQIIDVNQKKYMEFIEGNYSEVTSALTFSSLNYGNYLTYILLIENTNLEKSIYLSSNFTYNLESAKGAVNYSLCNIEINEYANDFFKNNNIGSLSSITHTSYLSKSYNLYELENNRDFIQDISLSPNSTMVIKYQIRCINDTEMVNFYNNYDQVYLQNYYEDYLAKLLHQETNLFINLENALVASNFNKENINSLVDDILLNELSPDLERRLNKFKNISSEETKNQKAELTTTINDFLEGETASINISAINIIIDY